MIYPRGHLARPLDAVLSAASRLSVLRVLRGVQEGRSGRAVARLAGINHQSAAVALKELEALGVVQSRSWGRKTLWRLDGRRWLVSEILLPMLDQESDHAGGVAAEIKARLRGKCRAVLLVGAAARGRAAPGEPLSLVAIEGGARRGLAGALRELKAELSVRWAVKLDARVLSAREAVLAASLEDAWRLLPDEGPGCVSA